MKENAEKGRTFYVQIQRYNKKKETAYTENTQTTCVLCVVSSKMTHKM